MVMILILMIILGVGSHTLILMNVNYLILIMIFVVSSIFTFVLYYISGDVSNNNFILVILIFLSLIVLMLITSNVLIFVGWEGIGVMSILLISYWIRPSGNSSAISAIMYNRWSDLVFLMILFQMNSELIILIMVFAVLCNSSLYLWSYWLPVAMESPTPVSSLLHSSTIVVAGVYLIILMGESISIIILVVLLLSINIIGHFDIKKNIAYSTSIHLLVIMILSSIILYNVVVMYIILHGMVKSQIFQLSSYTIHGIGSQDIRNHVINVMSYLILVGIFMLSAMIGIVMVIANEVVVLGIISVMMIILVFLSYNYMMSYINKLELNFYVSEMESLYVIVIVVCSMNVIMVNFNVWVSFIVIGIFLVSWIGNPMTTLV